MLSSPREVVRYQTDCVLDDFFRQQIECLAKIAKNNSKIGLIFSDKMWYYQFFNQNPSWKIYPLRYELLTENKLKNLDYIVICNNEQIVFNLDKSKTFLRYNKINFKSFKDFELVYKAGCSVSLYKQ